MNLFHIWKGLEKHRRYLFGKMQKRSERRPAPRYKNPKFLKALGDHCQKERIKKGYSIDRMSKEGDQLGSGLIHRLEMGQADVHVSALLRYAEVLQIPLKKLFEFQYEEMDR